MKTTPISYLRFDKTPQAKSPPPEDRVDVFWDAEQGSFVTETPDGGKNTFGGETTETILDKLQGTTADPTRIGAEFMPDVVEFSQGTHDAFEVRIDGDFVSKLTYAGRLNGMEYWSNLGPSLLPNSVSPVIPASGEFWTLAIGPTSGLIRHLDGLVIGLWTLPANLVSPYEASPLTQTVGSDGPVTIHPQNPEGVFDGQRAINVMDAASTIAFSSWSSARKRWEIGSDVTARESYESFWRRMIQSRRPYNFASYGFTEGSYIEFIYSKRLEGSPSFVSFPEQSVTIVFDGGSVVETSEVATVPQTSEVPDDLAWGAVKLSVPPVAVDVNRTGITIWNYGGLVAIDLHDTHVQSNYNQGRLKCLLGMSAASMLGVDPLTPSGSGGNLVLNGTTMEAEDLDHVFRMLPDGASGQIISIYNNPGTYRCNPAIATAKGYVVTDSNPIA